MSDFAVYESRSTTAQRYPYLIDVQSPLLAALDTRLVIPLVRRSDAARQHIQLLNPVVTLGGEEYLALTQQMAAIPRTVLGPLVGDAMLSRTEILGSIDFLVTGI